MLSAMGNRSQEFFEFARTLDMYEGRCESVWHEEMVNYLQQEFSALCPCNEDLVQRRALEHTALVEEASKDKSGHCQMCKKHFGSKKSYEIHLDSKRHKVQEAKSARRKEAREAAMAAKNAKNAALTEFCRAHKQSERHVYNMNRGLAGLPPLTEEEFHKIQEQQDVNSEHPLDVQARKFALCEKYAERGAVAVEQVFGRDRAFDYRAKQQHKMALRSDRLIAHRISGCSKY